MQSMKTPNNRLMGPSAAGGPRRALWLCVLLVSCNVMTIGHSQARALDQEVPSAEAAAAVGAPGAGQLLAGSAAPETRAESSGAVAPATLAVAEPAKELAADEKAAGAMAKETDKPQAGSPEQPTKGSDASQAAAKRQEEKEEGEEGAPAARDTPTTTAATATTERDLKSLLENKNDAENDLAAAPAVAAAPKAASDAPISVASASAESGTTGVKPNDDRFHYSIGGGSGAEKPSEGGANAGGDGGGDDDQADEEVNKQPDQIKPVVELEGKKEQSERPIEATDTKVIVDAPTSGPGEELEPKRELPSSAPAVTTKEPPAGTTTTTTPAPSTTTESAPKVETTSAAVDLAPPSTTIQSTGERPLERGEAKKPLASGATSSADGPTTTTVASDEKTTSDKDRPADTTTSASVVTSPSPAATSAASPGMVAKSDSSSGGGISSSSSGAEKPAAASEPTAQVQPAPSAAALPGVVSSAVGAAASAAGAAAGSALGNALAGKDKPPVAGAPAAGPATATSTKAPSSTRKSTANKWDRWQPTTGVPTTSSSTLVPPTRRRPILPSIRRRFRPYNRFSPFPWAPGGPESYSPYDPSVADAEPDFGLGSRAPPAYPSTPKPRRRASTTSAVSLPTRPSTANRQPTSFDGSLDDEVSTPNVSTRRRNPTSKRRHPNPHHHHHRNPDSDQSDSGYSSSRPDHHHRRSHHNRPSYGGPYGAGGPREHRTDSFSGGSNSFDPFSSSSSFGPRPFGSSGFGLFNSPASGPGGSSSTGSGFDLLNPFSWLDEVTKPRPPPHNTPHGQRRPFGGGASESRPVPPSGERPIAVEGEFNGARPGSGGDLDASPHDHHHHNHRDRPPYGVGGRPVRGDDYDDYDCHGHGHDHGHDHEHDHEHEHHEHGRPHRPYRPSREPPVGRPIRGDDYDYNSRPVGGYGHGRPERPPFRRDESTRTESSRTGDSGTRETESSGSGAREERRPPLGGSGAGSGTAARPHQHHHSERHSSTSGLADESASAAAAPPRRVPASVFSPFDSLFGSIDEDLFGGLRSSFVDAPLKAASDSIRNTQAAFDAIVSSPKISLPASSGPVTAAAVADKRLGQPAAVEPAPSARVIVQPIARLTSESEMPEAPLTSGAHATGKPTSEGCDGEQAAGSSSAKSELRNLIERIKSLRSLRQQLREDETAAAPPPPPATADADKGAPPTQPNGAATFQGGLKQFLLLI